MPSSRRRRTPRSALGAGVALLIAVCGLAEAGVALAQTTSTTTTATISTETVTVPPVTETVTAPTVTQTVTTPATTTTVVKVHTVSVPNQTATTASVTVSSGSGGSSGLPGWGWVLIGAGAVGLIFGAVVLLRRPSQQQGYPPRDGPEEPYR